MNAPHLHTFTEQGRPAWSLAWVRPYESAFNWLQKYAWANLAKGSDIMRDVFGKQAYNPHRRPINLLTDDCSAFEAAHQPQGLDLRLGMTSHYGQRWPARFARQTRLRICTPCLSEGYHSLFHQFDAIAGCPIHRQTLIMQCPHCAQPLPPVELAWNTFSHPFACEHCHRLLAPLDPRKWNRNDEFDAIVARKLRPIAEWLQQLECITEYRSSSSAPLEQWARDDSDPTRSCHAHWFEAATRIVSCPLPGDLLAFERRPLRVRRVAAKPDLAVPSRFEHDDEAHTKRAIAKSVRRYLQRTVLRTHRRCIARMRVGTPQSTGTGTSNRYVKSLASVRSPRDINDGWF